MHSLVPDLAALGQDNARAHTTLTPVSLTRHENVIAATRRSPMLALWFLVTHRAVLMKISVSRRSGGMVGRAVAGILLGAAGAASAQVPGGTAGDAAARPSTERLEELVVIGSNIRRADMERTVPVTVIDQDAMEVRGAVLPVDLLTSLPSVVNLPQNETRLGSSGARGDNAI